MIESLLREINNFFVRDRYTGDSISSKAIGIDGTENYIAGQYVYLSGTALSDGVYKISTVDSDEIVLDEEVVGDLKNESGSDFYIYTLAIPNALLKLKTEIEAFKETRAKAVDSESLGDYSVKYSSGNQGDTSWKGAFESELNEYRLMYLDLEEQVFENGYRKIL
jgi:hypothetical protein